MNSVQFLWLGFRCLQLQFHTSCFLWKYYEFKSTHSHKVEQIDREFNYPVSSFHGQRCGDRRTKAYHCPSSRSEWFKWPLSSVNFPCVWFSIYTALSSFRFNSHANICAPLRNKRKPLEFSLSFHHVCPCTDEIHPYSDSTVVIASHRTSSSSVW